MKRGKEFNIDVDNFNVLVGTVDDKNPKSLYITISGWGKPKIEFDVNYNKVINNIKKTIKKNLYELVDENLFIKEQIVVDLDMRESGIKFNRRSYICCEIILFQQKDYLSITSNKIITHTNKIINSLLDNILENNQYFTFHKTKKDKILTV